MFDREIVKLAFIKGPIYIVGALRVINDSLPFPRQSGLIGRILHPVAGIEKVFVAVVLRLALEADELEVGQLMVDEMIEVHALIALQHLGELLLLQVNNRLGLQYLVHLSMCQRIVTDFDSPVNDICCEGH